jgi:hypothetical protein
MAAVGGAVLGAVGVYFNRRRIHHRTASGG